MKKQKRISKRKESYDKLYREIVKTGHLLVSQNETLEQPHTLQIVDTVTTYGAFEKPI